MPIEKEEILSEKETTSSLNEYIEYVEKLASTMENEVFFNSGPTHASIVMSRIFKYSNKTVKIFCGGFNGDVSNDPTYLKYAEEFLNKSDTKLIAIVENDLTANSNSMIFDVLKNYKDKVSIYNTNARIKYSSDSNADKFIHFAIGDDKMLRVETGIEEYVAQVNFGDVEETKIYVDLFNQLLDTNPTKIELQTN